MKKERKEALYKLAEKDVSVSMTYNDYIANRQADALVDINLEYGLIEIIEKHIGNVNSLLNSASDDRDSYCYLTERVVYWSNILLHEFEVYVDFTIPSPKSLFMDE
jgi:hypothetical protein